MRVIGRNVLCGESGTNIQPFAFVATGGVSLAPPSPVSPSDGSNLSEDTPDFRWTDVSGADRYRLQYSTDDTFGENTVSQENIRGDNYQISADNSLTEEVYYWRVRSVDDHGNLSSWSEVWSFTVDVTAPTVTIAWPSEGENIASDNVNVKWTASDDGSGVDNFEVGLEGGSWKMIDDNTVDNYNFTDLTDGDNTAYVRAVDYAGNSAEDNVSFTVDTTPPSIENVSVIVSTENALITWTTDEVATSKVTWDNEFVSDDALVEEHSVALEGLEPETTYAYQIITGDGAGNQSQHEGTFTTGFGEVTSLEVTPPDNVEVMENFQVTVTGYVDNQLAANAALENLDIVSEHDGLLLEEDPVTLDENGRAVLTVPENVLTWADNHHLITVTCDNLSVSENLNALPMTSTDYYKSLEPLGEISKQNVVQAIKDYFKGVHIPQICRNLIKEDVVDVIRAYFS